MHSPDFFHVCFRNDHVGHAQATTAKHNYENIQTQGFYFNFVVVIQQGKDPKSRDLYFSGS